MFPQYCGMSKRTFKKIRNALLKVLKDGQVHSYGALERKVNTNWQTIRDHCENLEFFGIITVDREGVRLTKEGTKL
jgi:predicted transcriptional regulator